MYQSLCNYLRVPENSGEGVYYEFDIKRLCEYWKLDMRLVANVLKTLEQAGYISFQENVFIPSRCEFITSKEILYEFEKANPKLDPVIKCLLRTYEGIFTNNIAIYENTIAKLLSITVNEVIHQLHQLTSFNIIHYQPQKDTPQIYFLYNRVPKDDLRIDQQAYNERKALLEERVGKMIAYAAKPVKCRSEIIRNYFGDNASTPCGICDVCLQKAQQPATHAEVLEVVGKVKSTLQKPLYPDELKRLLAVRKLLFEKVIQLMVDEEIVTYDSEGKLTLKK